MFTIKNIGTEQFAIAGCPLLNPGDTAEVSAFVVEMVRHNPNIEILSNSLKGVEPEGGKKTNTKSLKGVE